MNKTAILCRYKEKQKKVKEKVGQVAQTERLP